MSAIALDEGVSFEQDWFPEALTPLLVPSRPIFALYDALAETLGLSPYEYLQTLRREGPAFRQRIAVALALARSLEEFRAGR